MRVLVRPEAELSRAPVRLAFLDGVRGLAAFAVVLSHVAALSYVPWGLRPPTVFEYALWHLGAPAVDLFFVLSGFVVARAIARRGFSPAALRIYLARRLVRLLPVAYLAVVLGFTSRALLNVEIPSGASVLLRTLSEPLSSGDLLGFLTLLWPVPNANRLNPPLWTLVVEWQAAFVMPLLAWLALRLRLWSVLPVAGLALTLGALGFPSLLYLPLFALGAAVGLSFPERGRLSPALASGLLLLGLGALLSRWLTNEEDVLYRWVTGVGAAGMVYALCHLPHAAAWLERPALQHLGRVSYSLYATHFPVLLAVAWGLSRVGVPLALGGLLAVPLTLLAASLAYRLIEAPSLRASRAIGRVAPSGDA